MMAENKSDKRIIAIAVPPKAYDEILKLKGARTWTKWLIELMLLENPTNEILNNEMHGFTEPKAEKPKAEPKPRKAEAKARVIEAETKAEQEFKVEFGKIDPLTGGVPIDIKKIGRDRKVEVEV